MKRQFFRGQIWYYTEVCNKYKQSGSVQHGSRPVIIISNDIGNTYSPILTVVPCTTRVKNSIPTHFKFNLDGVFNTAMCEQIFTIDKNSLTNCLGRLTDIQIHQLNNCIYSAIIANKYVPKYVISNASSSGKYYMRTDDEKRAIINEYNAIRNMDNDDTYRQEINAICGKYHFSSPKMLYQSIKRWQKI